MNTNAELARTAARTPEGTLREVIAALAPIEREAGGEGERQAAEWLAARLRKAGAEARVEEERYRDGFGGLLASLSAAAAAAGLLGATHRLRLPAAAVSAAAAGLIADDISNGARPFRKAVAAERTTSNVVAEIGDPEAPRRLVLLAHHDAAKTGLIFDPTLQRKLGDLFPGVIERIDTSLPQWWAALAGPLLAAVGSARGRRRMALAGSALSALGVGVLSDIERSEIVPGANDNLSGVAVLVALAEALAAQPPKGVRVQLVSCGAEEVLQGGIHGFCSRHLADADRQRTWVLNFDTVGSPGLVMLEGEGCLVMEDYFDRTWRDLIWRVADHAGVPMRRGMRSRSSTDSVVPSRMRIPTATITSVDSYKLLSNYHWPTDTPENVRYPTVACAADLAELVVRELEVTAPR